MFRIIFISFLFCSCGFFQKKEEEKQPSLDATLNILTIPFPHPPEFSSIEKHGFLALLPELKAQCLDCHNGKTVNTPTCDGCHQTYPHGWQSDLKAHGSLATSSVDGCYACHLAKENLLVQGPAKSHLPPLCTQCHSYPHASEWSQKNSLGFHGNSVLLSGKEDCKNCHGENFEGGTDGAPRCSECHKNYPHEDILELHRSTSYGLNRQKMIAECVQCHFLQKPENLTPSFSQQDCSSCHQSYPHSDPDWNNVQSSSNFHGAMFKKDSTQCVGCHGDQLDGLGNLSKDCHSCHKDYPHDENWKQTGKHGEIFEIQQRLDNASCKSCHGKQLQGGNFGQACDSCHAF